MLLGTPGRLARLPQPTGDLPHPAEYDAAVHKLLAGRAVDFPGGDPKRAYKATWQGLGHDDWSTLEAYASRQRGFGPWVLYLDETRRNYLTANQASGTDAAAGVEGFSVAAGSNETLASSTAQARSGIRSLLWTLPASVTSGLLTIACPVATFAGWPTPASQPWSLSAYVRTGGTDSTFDVRARLRWLNSAGSTLSTSDGSFTAGSSSAFTRISVTATAPANAVYVLPLLQVDATDVSGAAQCFVDDVQLEFGTVGTALAGTGLPIVSIIPDEHDMPSADWHTVTWTLQEV